MQTILGATKELTLPDFERARKATWFQRNARGWMAFLLVLSDSLSLIFSGLLAIALRAAMGEIRTPAHYLRMAPLLIVFLIVYTWKGLYPAVGLSPVEELRRLTISTSVVFLLVTGFTFWARIAGIYSRLVFAFTWILAVVFVQLSRWIVRYSAVRLGVWGEPVAVVGCGSQSKQVVQYLLRNARLGLRPIVVIDGFDPTQEYDYPIPRLRLTSQDAAVHAMRTAGVRTAILISSEMPETLQEAIVDQEKFGFQRMIMVSDFRWIGSLGVTPYDFEGFLGLEVRHNLLNIWEQRIKRAMDLTMVFLLGIFLLPITAIVAILVRLDSPGKVIYRHKRIGKDGIIINVLKFRTMIMNAPEVLDEYLKHHPEARKEWETTHKLKNDPRVTKIGGFLRKLSLDEVPQFWNVLIGEMSIVGPRPIVDDEIRHYSEGFSLYMRVRPGITGLWQVSGRNDVGYGFRVHLDEYYVRNWSIWLDTHILIKTFLAVVLREGAY